MAKLSPSVARKVYFYELISRSHEDFELSDEKYDTLFQELFSKIVQLVKQKKRIRYQDLNEHSLFINEIKFIPTQGEKIVRGKLLSVRKDLFPELMNTSTDNMRDIDALEDEGIVETTHFLIKESNKNRSNKVRICIEHNQFGAKITDLVYYLSKLGLHLKITSGIAHAPIVRDNLSKLKSRIGEISKILIKIKSDHIESLNSVDTGIASMFVGAREEFSQQYVTMEFKYDYTASKFFPTSDSAQKSKDIVKRFIDFLTSNKKNTDVFYRLLVTAQDEEKNNRLQAFDLLIDKAKDEFKVARREKSKALVSEDMFEKMTTSLKKNRI